MIKFTAVSSLFEVKKRFMSHPGIELYTRMLFFLALHPSLLLQKFIIQYNKLIPWYDSAHSAYLMLRPWPCL